MKDRIERAPSPAWDGPHYPGWHMALIWTLNAIVGVGGLLALWGVLARLQPHIAALAERMGAGF